MEIEIQGSLVKVKNTSAMPWQKKLKHKRGKVTSFTKKSRKRLLEMIARLRTAMQACFITLTYGQAWPSEKIAKKHLKAFIRRIRKHYPRASIIWRLEYQKRGAPHFHLIVFRLPFIPKEKVAQVWAEIIGAEFCDNSREISRPPFTRIESIDNKRKAMMYVAKYVAKAEGGGFNNVPYQNQHSEGRFWGICGRKYIEFAVLTTSKIEHMATFHSLCSLAKKLCSKIKFFRIDQGFTIFDDNAVKWLMMALQEDDYFNGHQATRNVGRRTASYRNPIPAMDF